MTMAKNYTVTFMSLRNGRTYTLNIGGGTGTAVALMGAAQPFTTEEDADEDMFADVRTQSGSIRVLSTDGGALWSDIAPTTDTARPVTLTHTSGSTTVVDWQGFVQSQIYGHELFGDPQELEIPVMCPLSALQTRQVSIDETEIRNFAYLIKYIIDEIRVMGGGSASTYGSGMVEIKNVVIGGGIDAREWLLKKFDWQNFASFNDDDYDRSKYDLYSVLEDMCRFWGWTARTQGDTLYLTNADDTAEQSLLTLTYTQLTTLATSGGSIGTVSNPTTWAIPQVSGTNPFVNTNNEEDQVRGPNRAVVTANVNKEDTVMKFAPKIIKDELGSSWSWVQGNNDLVGYFTTPTVYSFGQTGAASKKMSGTATANGGFCRRQIFTSREQDKADSSDIILMHAFSSSTPCSQIVVKRWRNYGGGSLSVSGTLYQGSKDFEATDDSWFVFLRIGIGSSRSTAKWCKLTCDASGNITHAWVSSPQLVAVRVAGNSLQGFAAYNLGAVGGDIDWGTFASIPVANGLNGQLFIDFMGCHSYNGGETTAELANFEVDMSRDATYILNNTEQHRPRTMSDERVSSKEYSSDNRGKADDEWNADCIFASDNNMEYGYGLLMNADGTWMTTAPYGNSEEHPEQHLASRVTSYWYHSRKMLTVDVAYSEASGVNPSKKVNMKDMTWHPIAIGHDWREDIVTLTMLEL